MNTEKRLVVASLLFLYASSCASLKKSEPIVGETKTKSTVERNIERHVAGDASLVTQAWTQFGTKGEMIARALTIGGACPQIKVDDNYLTMSMRGVPSETFSVNVCEVKVSEKAKSISIGDVKLSTLPAKVEKILVLGDTGCRIVKRKKDYIIQNCNDPVAWPFARLAKAAAEWGPDLVIHVGDYHYREAPCPENDSRCAGDISGDNWHSWQDDFFSPALPLLKKAPWVFVRGNHELCSRGGYGWFKFLDPNPFSEACVDKTDAYWVKFGEHMLAVIDSAEDSNIQPSLDSLQAPSSSLVWVALHRPFLTVGADDETSAKPSVLNDNLRSKISAVFAGHQHQLSFNQFADARPPELISGNSGSMLEPAPKIANPSEIYKSFSQFGFLTLEKKSDQTWDMIEHDVSGDEMFHCTLTEVLGSKAKIDCGK